MHLQAGTLPGEPEAQTLSALCFLFVRAVHQSIVRIPTTTGGRVCPNHPEIERVVEKNVTQNWANHSPYAKGNFGRLADFGGEPPFCGGLDGTGILWRMVMVSSPTRTSLTYGAVRFAGAP